MSEAEREGYSPVISGGGEDGHHQLQVRADLRPDRLQVSVCPVIRDLHDPGIMDLGGGWGLVPVTPEPTPGTSIPMGGATRLIVLTNSTAFALSLFVTTTIHFRRGT